MTAQTAPPQEIIDQLQASCRHVNLGDTGKRGQPSLGAKGLTDQINFIGNRKMKGLCHLLYNLGMTFTANGPHPIRMGRLGIEPGMGYLFVAGLRVPAMASVTGKVMLLIQGQGVATQTATIC